jgi:hypothetical protein
MGSHRLTTKAVFSLQTHLKGIIRGRVKGIKGIQGIRKGSRSSRGIAKSTAPLQCTVKRTTVQYKLPASTEYLYQYEYERVRVGIGVLVSESIQ